LGSWIRPSPETSIVLRVRPGSTLPIVGGHLFVVQGDLRALACDAWILPTSRGLSITAGWLRDWPRALEVPPEPDRLPEYATGELMPWPGWPAERSPPWLGAIATGQADATWPARCATRWLEQIAASLAGRPPRHGRRKHLVGLPVLGTGAGGHYHDAGEVLKSLIPAVRAQAEALDLDVAMVTFNAETFAAARAVRGTDPSSWPELDAAQVAAARLLARRAGAGELVLFLGAGVSAGAGLPDWNGLLAEMARTAGIDPEADGWSRLDVLDRASILQRRLPDLGERIADQFRRPEAALQHLLLASLPVHEAITTNYDDLFELASGASTVSVLPHGPRAGARRWLLKMHGCVSRPADIVLTREDYLRYEQRRVALAGIVQAMLMTRHMLFVGFSLKDENFHKVADAVRRARDPEPGQGTRFGTVLQLAAEPFVEELWKQELDFVSLGADPRRLEVFLDCVLAHAPHHPMHFLHDRFASTLSDGERTFRDELVELLGRLPRDAQRGPAWERLRALITQLGGG
jgi:hypothetical protein